MSYWPTRDEELRIRAYIYQSRFSDAISFYKGCKDCSDEQAEGFVSGFAADLRKSPGYLFKVAFFRILRALSLSLPISVFFALAGLVWGSALGRNAWKSCMWTFIVSGLLVSLLSMQIRNREQSFVLGSVCSGATVLAIALGLIVGLARRMLF